MLKSWKTADLECLFISTPDQNDLKLFTEDIWTYLSLLEQLRINLKHRNKGMGTMSSNKQSGISKKLKQLKQRPKITCNSNYMYWWAQNHNKTKLKITMTNMQPYLRFQVLVPNTPIDKLLKQWRQWLKINAHSNLRYK